MKFKEIAQVPAKEQELKVRQGKADLMALTIKKSAGQLDKPHTMRALRREIARRLTALNQKAKK
jgi:large subunit ribosomal protein L29